MDGTVPPVRTDVVIVLRLISVYTPMAVVLVTVVMVSLETRVWMVSCMCHTFDSQTLSIFVPHYGNITIYMEL